MILLKKDKLYYTLFIIIGLTLCSFKVLAFFSDPVKNINFENVAKSITLNDDGFNFRISTTANTVSDLIKEQKINLNEHDRITPDMESRIYAGAHIEIQRATKIKITADGHTGESYVLGKTVRDALHENQITLSRLDKTVPASDTLVQNDLLITVTRINVEEVTAKESVVACRV